MPKPKIKSGYVKKLLARHILMNQSYSIVATEYDIFGCKADVFMLNQNDYTFEYEIKVSKQDLSGELQAIKEAYSTGYTYKAGESKHHKHSIYKTSYKNNGDIGKNHQRYIPNYFYFVVPFKLKEEALAGIAGTPYGLICVDEKYNDPQYIVRPKQIHDKKCSEEMVKRLARRTCFEKFFPRKNF